MSKLVVDTCPIKFSIEEGSSGGRLRVRGEFAKAGIATENKRVYPKKVWEKEIRRLEKAMTERKVLGELDHPSDGRTSLDRVSHIVTGLRLENGILVGEAEILDTDKGRNLAALMKAGVQVGVSSRGYGSTKPNELGEEVVQEDYRLVTFDFVAEPADSTAYPEVFFEGVDVGVIEKQLAEAAAKTGNVVVESSDTAPVVNADDVLAKLAEMRAEVVEQVRTEMLADPEIAGAKLALERVKEILRPFVLPEDAESVVASKDAEISRLQKQLAERDLRVTELETDNSKLSEAVKDLGYRLYIERATAGNPNAGLIKQMIGDVKQYADAAALKKKFEDVSVELEKKVVAEETERSKLVAEKTRARAEAAESESKITALGEAVEKLLKVVERQRVALYSEKQLRNNPRSAKIAALIEKIDPQSEDEVDEIIQENAPRAPKDDDEAADVRSRVRRAFHGGSESRPDDETTPRKALKENYNDLGLDVEQIRKLSGVSR